MFLTAPMFRCEIICIASELEMKQDLLVFPLPHKRHICMSEGFFPVLIREIIAQFPLSISPRDGKR